MAEVVRRVVHNSEGANFVEEVFEQKDSIEVSRNAKGDITWSIKLYVDSFEGVVDRINSIRQEVEAKVK